MTWLDRKIMNWDPIVRHYSMDHRPRKEREFSWFSQQPSLEEAIIVAASATNERGKRYSHQSRIRRSVIKEAKILLLDRAGEIEKCDSFHSLWMLVKRAIGRIYGVGELYIYDTCLRIGIFLNMLPEKVYLHAGTRSGAKAYGLMNWDKEWIETHDLPEGIRDLPRHEIEDILCIYKDKASTSRPDSRLRC
jgi:hypothetical protein